MLYQGTFFGSPRSNPNLRFCTYWLGREADGSADQYIVWNTDSSGKYVFGKRQSHDPLGHLWAEGRNPRGPAHLDLGVGRHPFGSL